MMIILLFLIIWFGSGIITGIVWLYTCNRRLYKEDFIKAGLLVLSGVFGIVAILAAIILTLIDTIGEKFYNDNSRS